MKTRMVLLAGLILFAVTTAHATPTPTDRRLLWDPSPSADVAGNFLYWARASEPEPRVYDDTRRVDLGALTVDGAGQKSAVVIDAKPNAEGGLCFRVTAYDAAGNESDFSNEACGFFGLPGGTNLRTAP